MAKPSDPGFPSALPLVGRETQLALLRGLLERASEGAGSTVFLAGEGGVGKTRLAGTVTEAAAKQGWNVVVGRAYAVETGIPYALFSDGFLPALKQLEPSALSVLTRGGVDELTYLFPPLGSRAERAGAFAGTDAAELKSRILWNFAQFLGRYAARQPLCILLENLQWADASSLELFHFVARQVPEQRILVIATYNEAEREHHPTLRTTEQSLIRLGVAVQCRLEPLSHAEVGEMLQRAFGVDPASIRQFTALLYGWTRGNPFFLEETLKSLVSSGVLHREAGAWHGWDVESLQLPATVRDAVAGRLEQLSQTARDVANRIAVVGARVTFDQLAIVTGMADESLASALDELVAQKVVVETGSSQAVQYDFAHPILQQVTYAALGGARSRVLHAGIAEALESYYGPQAESYAAELAFHFSRAHTFGPQAVRYLHTAGMAALGKYSNREAAAHLAEALTQIERSGEEAEELDEILRGLARARQRLGEYDAALDLWSRARERARATGDSQALASIEHRMGLACYWSGRLDDALEHYAAGLESAAGTADQAVTVRLHLANGICLQDLGQLEESKAEVESALSAAEAAGNDALLARAHRALLLLYTWTGPNAIARAHGEKALQLAEASGDRMLEWTARWGMALFAGLSTDAAAFRHHLEESDRIAEELRSPLLPIWSAELWIQYRSSVGEWESGLATGERTIELAQTFGQRALIPRLYVWTGMIYLWRGEVERARSYFDTAWELAMVRRGSRDRLDVPTIVPVHMGLATYHLETDNCAEAIRLGEEGLAIADRCGYTAWALQWLLPVIGEAALWIRDFERAERHSARMRRDATRLGNRLGLAAADACDGMLLLYRDQNPGAAIPPLLAAVEVMDSIPVPEWAARVRRVLAKAHADRGNRDEAVRVLRKAHDIFARLGAASSLNAVREELRELGSRLPARTVAAGAGGLTGREVEIARMIAQRRSNKEIGAALEISARTVSTHLSNIFTKLGVASRGELADFVREKSLIES